MHWTRRRQTLTPDQWRIRAQAIAADLEGVSIAELMRGGSPNKTGHDAQKYDPTSRAYLRVIPMEDNGHMEPAVGTERLTL
jgi:hypothetical protein